MSEPQTLVQAALNRLSARLGSGLADAAAGLAVLAQDAPERLRQEWDLFKEEVELEAQRLEHGDQEVPAAESPMASSSPAADPQTQIDQLLIQVPEKQCRGAGSIAQHGDQPVRLLGHLPGLGGAAGSRLDQVLAALRRAVPDPELLLTLEEPPGDGTP